LQIRIIQGSMLNVDVYAIVNAADSFVGKMI
jgi:O-acetyl-ADP-ribose deacetylase (regulator of RNase III)